MRNEDVNIVAVYVLCTHVPMDTRIVCFSWSWYNTLGFPEHIHPIYFKQTKKKLINWLRDECLWIVTCLSVLKYFKCENLAVPFCALPGKAEGYRCLKFL